MNVKALIELNNESREKLTDDNKKYYEKFLIYIRLSSSKSEKETEEILYEILEHLLEAQADGKKPEDVFGDNPKEYADEIIGELPKMLKQKQFNNGLLIISNFLGVFALAFGIINTLFSLFGDFDPMFTFGLGSGLSIVIIAVLNAFLTIVVVIKWLRWSAFKQQKKWKEFLQTFSMGVGSAAIFILPRIFIPKFGMEISIPMWSLIPIGLVFLGIGRYVIKRD
ncbi:DUF1129 family protein [Salipaludibacillus sp. HK11]|uniref:DUF1129 family protein n=1 Tax=Salipaludibacillus sp. HK11 TaxID=3394320 RepID=UPI0039FC0450